MSGISPGYSALLAAKKRNAIVAVRGTKISKYASKNSGFDNGIMSIFANGIDKVNVPVYEVSYSTVGGTTRFEGILGLFAKPSLSPAALLTLKQTIAAHIFATSGITISADIITLKLSNGSIIIEYTIARLTPAQLSAVVNAISVRTANALRDSLIANPVPGITLVPGAPIALTTGSQQYLNGPTVSSFSGSGLKLPDANYGQPHAGTLYDGASDIARYGFPVGMAMVGSVLYVADESLIRAVSPSGSVTTIYNTQGNYAGTPYANSLTGLVSANGICYYSDGLSKIYKFNIPNNAGKPTGLTGFPSFYSIPSNKPIVIGGQTSSGYTEGIYGTSLFNMPSGLAIKSATTPHKPTCIAFHHDSGDVFFATDGGNYICRLNTTTGLVIAKYPYTITGNHGLIISMSIQRNGNSAVLYLATVFQDGTVAEFSLTPATSTVVLLNTYSGYGATKIVFDSAGSGTFWFLTTSGAIKVRNPAYSAVVATGIGLPYAIAVDTSGNIYVTDYNNGSVMKYTSSGVGTVFVTGLSYVYAIAVDTSGNVYVSDFNSLSIMKYTSSGVGTVFATGLRYPHAIAVDPSGNVYVSDSSNRRVMKYTSSRVGTVFATGISLPYGIAIDISGNIYVSDYNNGSVMKYTSSGVGTVFVTGLTNPTGVAIDNTSGNIYVVNNGLVMKYTSSGVGTVFVTGPSYIHAIAVDTTGNVYSSYAADGSVRKYIPEHISTFYEDPLMNNGGNLNNLAIYGSDANGIGNVIATNNNYMCTFENRGPNVLAFPTIIGFVLPTPMVDMTVSLDSTTVYIQDTASAISTTTVGTWGMPTAYYSPLYPITMAGAVATNAGLCFADSTNANISVIDPLGNIITEIYAGPKNIQKVAYRNVNSIDYVYTANGTSGIISQTDTTTGVSTIFASGFVFPSALAFDSTGNLYVSDGMVNTVSKIDSLGNVTLFASGFSFPSALAFDSTGNLFVANNHGKSIMKVDTSGTVTTFTSNIIAPITLAIDSADMLYVTCFNDYNGVYVINNLSGAITTNIAGSNFGSELIAGLVIDKTTDIFYATAGSHIYKYDGVTSSIYGSITGAVGGISLGSVSGELYVTSDTTHIHKVNAGGQSTITNYAFSISSCAYDSYGRLYVGSDQSSSAIIIVLPTGETNVFCNTPASLMCFDSNDILYCVTGFNVRSIDTNGTITNDIVLLQPIRGLAFYGTTLYVNINDTIRLYDSTLTLLTSIDYTSSLGYNPGYIVVDATYFYIIDVAPHSDTINITDHSGVIQHSITGITNSTALAVDSIKHKMYVITNMGTIANLTMKTVDLTTFTIDTLKTLSFRVGNAIAENTLIKSTGIVVSQAGAVTIANSLSMTGITNVSFIPTSIVMTTTTTDILYVADAGNDVVRAIDTLTGQTTTIGSGLSSPLGLALNATNNMLYLTDSGNHRICNINLLTNELGICCGSGIAQWVDGRRASFNAPSGIVCVSDKLYIADTGNNAIRRYDTALNLTHTVAGLPTSDGLGGKANGFGYAATFKKPTGLFYNNNKLLVAETDNCTIRKVDITNSSAQSLTILQTTGFYYKNLLIDASDNFWFVNNLAGDGTTIICANLALTQLYSIAFQYQVDSFAFNRSPTPTIYAVCITSSSQLTIYASIFPYNSVLFVQDIPTVMNDLIIQYKLSINGGTGTAIAIDSNENIFITNIGGNNANLLVLDSQGVIIPNISSTDNNNYLSTDPYGTTPHSDSANRGIPAFVSYNGMYNRNATVAGIAIDSSDTLHVTTYSADSYLYTLTTPTNINTMTWSAFGSSRFATSIFIDINDNMYITDQIAMNIQKSTAIDRTTLFTVFQALLDQNMRPNNACADSRGFVYFSNSDVIIRIP